MSCYFLGGTLEDRTERGERLCRVERRVYPILPGIKPYSWEPLGFLEVGTTMDLVLNMHNGVGIEHQGSHQLP